MKHFIIVLTFVILSSILGCDNQDKGYVENALDQKTKIKKITALQSARQAIKLYKVKHQVWPETLDQVDEMPELPGKWEWKYNNENGKIEVIIK